MEFENKWGEIQSGGGGGGGGTLGKRQGERGGRETLIFSILHINPDQAAGTSTTGYFTMTNKERNKAGEVRGCEWK